MRISSVRVRRLSTAMSLAMAAAVLAPATAWAGVPVSPNITAPAPGTTISSSPLSVSAESSAQFVRFDLGAGPIDSDIVEVTGGVATGSLEVFGLDGNVTITATDCSPGPVCGAPGDSIQVDVQLDPPTINSPKPKTYVRNSVEVNAQAAGGTVRYSLDGDPIPGLDPVGPPFDASVSLEGKLNGQHTIKVQQCNTAGTVCDGESDAVTVVKDTKPPNWTNVNASNKTVYPVKDNYKDSTRLSARVNEPLARASVEIRKAGGSVVRTFNLGRERAGSVAVNWNGRKANGDIVPNGKYTFQFIGKDRSGLTGKSRTNAVHVSGKKLVRKTVTKTVSALGSFAGNGSGDCSGVYRLDYPRSRYGWKSGLGYYSRSQCNGSRDDDVAIALHRIAAPSAAEHFSVKIDTYGGGAFRHAGPAIIGYVKKDRTYGVLSSVQAGLGWHGGPTRSAGPYLKKGKISWVFATVRGNWFDVKEFRVTFKVGVLQ